MKRRTIIVAVLALVLVVGVVLRLTVGRRPTSPGTAGALGRGGPRGPVAVVVEPVMTGRIKEEREFTGTVKAAHTYVVAAKIAGRLVEISKRIGDRVGRDESLGRIDDTEYRQAVNEAEAQTRVSKASVAEAKAQLAQAQRDQERVSELVAKGISSQAELEASQTLVASLESRLELARAQLAQREAALELSRTRLGYTRLKGSHPGYVAERAVDGGALLSMNAPVYTIVGIDTVYVEIALTEREYPMMKIGQKATVTVEALAGRTFTGILAHRAPMFKTASRTAVAEISIVNDSLLLKPGMFAKISVILSDKDSAQLVPLASVISRGPGSSVFAVDESGKTVREVKVTTGLADSGWIEVVSPKLTGNVVTLGNHLLRDGAEITTGASPRQPPGRKGSAGASRRSGKGS